jgi:hypothetical protein
MKNMFTSMKFQLAAVSTLLLASCAQTIDPRYATAQDMNIIKQAQGYEAEKGAMKGALIGAATGAGVAALKGGDKKDIVKGAGIGALAGGAIGGVAGFQKGDALGKAKVTDVKAQREKEAALKKDISIMKQKRATQNAILSKLRSDMKSAESPAARAKIAKQAETIISEMKKASSQTKSETADYKSTKGYSVLAKEIAQFEKQTEQAEKELLIQ